VAFLRLSGENQLQIHERLLHNQESEKSPFEKGGFKGILSGYYKSPLPPPLEKGGINLPLE
jgi:hypothetical protein